MRMGKGFDEDAKPFSNRPKPRPGPKRSVNLSINAEILDAAKAQGINLSQTLEDTLAKLTEEVRIAKWSEENRAFIDSYNAYIERNGVFGEEFQDWDDEQRI